MCNATFNNIKMQHFQNLYQLFAFSTFSGEDKNKFPSPSMCTMHERSAKSKAWCNVWLCEDKKFHYTQNIDEKIKTWTTWVVGISFFSLVPKIACMAILVMSHRKTSKSLCLVICMSYMKGIFWPLRPTKTFMFSSWKINTLAWVSFVHILVDFTSFGYLRIISRKILHLLGH